MVSSDSAGERAASPVHLRLFDFATERLATGPLGLSRLSDRAADTEIALGSDVMSMALQGCGLLKLTGRGEGLEPLRLQLGERFAKTPRQPQPTPEPVPQLARAA